MCKSYWAIEGENEMLTKSQAKKKAQILADEYGETVEIIHFKMDSHGVFFDEKNEKIFPKVS